MRKFYSKFLALFLLMSASVWSHAQTVDMYTFTAGTGTTLDPMTGSTVLIGPSVDDTPSPLANIGFTFTYGGINYTQFSVTPDGFVKLGPGAAVGQFTNAFNSTTNIPKIAAFWDDLATGVGGQVHYVVTGTAPNRILIVEWFVTVPRATTGNANTKFQMWLYETTGTIEFRYGGTPGTGTMSASVGLRGPENSTTNYKFNSVTISTNTNSTTSANNTNNAYPPVGTIYIFNPPPPCNVAPTAGTVAASPATVCAGEEVTLTLTGASVGTGITYQWQSSPNGTTWTDIPGANSSTLIVAPASNTQYQAVVTCVPAGNLTATTNSVAVTVTNPPTYAAFPYVQDFENWVNGCSTTDRPDNSWTSSPPTTNNSWRRDDQGSSAAWTALTSGPYSPAFSTTAHSARFHSWSASSGTSGSLSLYIDLSTNPQPKFLRFDYINTSGTDSLAVYLSTDGGASFTYVGAAYTSAAWAPRTFSINSNSATTVIKLVATSDFGTTDIGVDNLSVAAGCSGTPATPVAAINPTTACFGGSATLSATGITPQSGLDFQWQSSPNGTTWSNIPGANSLTYVLNNVTATNYRLVATCTNGNLTSTSNTVTATLSNIPVYASIPYVQDFESWINGCSTTDRPDASWSLSPVNSDSAWRRNDQGASASWTSITNGMYSPAASSGTFSARFHTWPTSSSRRGIMDLYVNLSTSTISKELSFDYINTSGSDSLVIFISEDGGANFTRLDSLRTRASWTKETYTLTSNSATVVIRFRATSDFGATDIGLDNLKIILGCNAMPNPGTVSQFGGANGVCVGGSTTLNLSGQSQAVGLVYLWQSSPDNATWTNIAGATGTSLQVSPTAATYYRVRVVCSNSSDTAYTAGLQINVNNPQLISTTPGTRCGPGSVALGATGSGNTTFNWYTSATGGAPIGTGATFNTPIISNTTTYYVAASSGGSGLQSVGAPNLSIGAPLVVGTYYMNFTVLAPVTIQSVDAYFNAVGSPFTLNIRDANTLASVFTYSGTTTVSGTATPQVLPINASLQPGTYQMGWTTDPGTYRVSTGAAYPYTLPGLISITGNTFNDPNYYYYFFNWQIQTGCESARQAVVATVTPTPAFDITNDMTICNNAITPLTVTSPAANFDQYTWTPVGGGLFSDAAATTPITASTNASTVYAQIGAAGTYTIIATANNTSTGCQNFDSLKVTVLPATVSVVASPSELCVSGTSTLSITPNPANFGTATYQWYSSPNNTTFTAIPGATSPTYTTPTINATTYYRIEVKNGAGAVCITASDTVKVNSPAILTSNGAALCGPGTLNLSATATPGATINWYTAPVGGQLVHTGGAFTTPNLSTTTTYYAAALEGGAGFTTGVTLSDLSIALCGLPTTTATTGWALRFTTTKAVIVNSVYVIPTAAGTVTIELHAFPSAGAIGTVTSQAFTAAQVGTPQQVNLGFTVSTPGNYQLVMASGGSNRITTMGCAYPMTTAGGGFSITGSANTISAAANTTTYNSFYEVNVTEGCESPRVPVVAQVSGVTAITQQPQNISTCVGANVNLVVVATGANLNFQWKKGGNNIAGATNDTLTLNPIALADAGTYSVEITGLCGNVTSQTITVNVSAANTWTGVLSTDWNTPGNWCGGVPTATTDVAIFPGTPYQPVINATMGSARNITINAGASLDIMPSGTLNIYGDLVNNGAFTAPGGYVFLKGAANQNIGTMTAGTVLVNGTGGVTLTGNMNVTQNLILTNGNVTLGVNNITVNGTVDGTPGSHVVTDGSGSMIMRNVGSNMVNIPVGPSAASYNPVTISNGSGRDFSVRVATGLTPQVSNPGLAVNRTWTITPSGTASNANITFKYDDAHMNTPGVPTSMMEVGVHNGTAWSVVTPIPGGVPVSGPAAARQVGFTTSQFGPMVVGNVGTISWITSAPPVDPTISKMVLMPNLVQNSTVLRVVSTRAARINWSVVDQSGRVVMVFNRQVMIGQTDITLELSKLAAGVYNIAGFTDKGKVQVLRFVKM